ncbi:MAG: integrin alpha, partial [Planctomycetales bacterium]
MLLNDWMSSLAGSYKRKRNTCSGLSRNRRRSARPRRQLQPCLIFSQPELLEDRVLLAATNPLDLATLDGTTGFRLDGIDADDWSGRSVSSAGDVNGDGFDDLIIGAFNADPNGGDSGETYVVFGKSGGFSAAVDLATLDGTTGFRLNGIVTRDHSGASVSSAGDVNGDG